MKTLIPKDDDWDLFISHASEDKAFVRPLAEALRNCGLAIWYDEFTLNVGDSLRRAIDSGLARAKHGVVVVSPSFLRKEWPLRELDALIARESSGARVILPVWHKMSLEELASESPILADRVATSSSRGIDVVVRDILRAIGRNPVPGNLRGPSPEALFDLFCAMGPSGAYPHQVARHFKCLEHEVQDAILSLVSEGMVIPAKMASTVNPVKYHLSFQGRKRFEAKS